MVSLITITLLLTTSYASVYPHTTSLISDSSTIKLNDNRHIPLFGLGVYRSRKGLETYNAVLTALRMGYRHIDTAERYENEEDVGKAVRDFLKESGLQRSHLWITTKLWPNGRSYSDVRTALYNSLEKLGLDYVDLYLIHSPNDIKNRVDQWKALVHAQQDGLAMSIGVSNYGTHHLQEILDRSEVKPSVNQIELSPFHPRTELVDYCRSHNIIPEAYSPLTKGQKLVDPKVVALSTKYGATPAQLLIQWCIQKEFITIPKSVNPLRIKENIDTLKRFDTSVDSDNVRRRVGGIDEDDMKLMDSWNEKLVTGWDPTVAL
mmetsp:Transcript_23194/g.34020  ORF Transcript_23194/g.34020 Transcript_23194/m.34020 type:complete len:319 (-) Transcript_23194:92-1048(-)|eukprot:CAMPEP_0185034390 /NCGR_PEP_ID=MMETSP1103-20130426/24254_1 /TAXON_ID=36769 /ORGANISM="Paraphysomonas bandaiensis, Strain Caron Lab Isolate" /LENGTH=318 /DNA_ID=CAMNT_0027571031 /DNA_START=79 /DNA_END=1035 /DNA_ORIENTATION=+